MLELVVIRIGNLHLDSLEKSNIYNFPYYCCL